MTGKMLGLSPQDYSIASKLQENIKYMVNHSQQAVLASDPWQIAKLSKQGNLVNDSKLELEELGFTLDDGNNFFYKVISYPEGWTKVKGADDRWIVFRDG